jgi:predicted dehydrogenase
MLKVAIVGCGQMADEHASQIQRIKGCEIVGVCDREGLMARQLAERFHIKRHFSELTRLIEETRPDVVHIATDPQSHFDVARSCLEKGCNTFVETPFTLCQNEAEELIGLAVKMKLKLTVGQDDQFGHAAQRLRQMVRNGHLGGTPVHMESYKCDKLSQARACIKARTTDNNGNSLRATPDQLLHNNICAGIAMIAEFLEGDSPRVVAFGFASPMRLGMSKDESADELRVFISDEKGTTAYFTFSSQMRPLLHQFRIYGPRNGLVLDENNETLILLRGGRFKSYAEHFLSPLVLAKQYVGNTLRNVRTFLANDFHTNAGLKELIECRHEGAH